MTDQITIDRLSLAGFRAYLDDQSFRLREGKTVKSLAVFAPNAKGKSSLIDAVEFFLSKDGTLKRIGQRRAGTHAGPDALRHVKAKIKGIKSKVSINFREGTKTFGDTRDLTKLGMATIPPAAERISDNCNVEFVIRGFELRRFVEERTSQERYEDVSEWLLLSPLLTIQKGLRELRLKLNQTIERDQALKERIQDLSTITDTELTKWDEKDVLVWLNKNHVQTLDKKLALTEFKKTSSAYKIIEERKKQEEERIGLGAIKAAIEAIKAVFEKNVEQEDGSKKDAGALVELKEAASSLIEAETTEKKEKAASQKAVFKDVWEAADELFSGEESLEDCPVCETPIQKSPHGDQEKICLMIKANLTDLQAYRTASQALNTAKQDARTAHTRLRSRLSTLIVLLRAAGYKDKSTALKEIETHRTSLGDAFKAPLPDTKAIIKELGLVLGELTIDQKSIEEAQGENTYANTLSIVDKLMSLREKLALLEKKKGELKKLYKSLVKAEALIAGELRNYLQKLIDKLQDRMAYLYGAIQPDPSAAPSIRFELDEESKQPQLHLVVDFAPNRKGVMPSGYLSDSQLHTLALSLRLAAIEKANENVPIMVLDDVVTSYDADHRKAIAALLAHEFADTQIIIVTHDERFFCYLQEHLPANSWYFKRIMELDENFGPRFHDHKITEEMIQGRWKAGESAANEIRQAEEEWLLLRARQFGVSVRIREVHHAHKYDRGELAQALHRFLIDSGVDIPKVKGISNPFFSSLQTGNVENFGSHFSDDPSAWSSEGDEKKRWQEFQEFCDFFVCKCGCKKFKRPKVGMKKAVCDKCETPFAFAIEEEVSQAG